MCVRWVDFGAFMREIEQENMSSQTKTRVRFYDQRGIHIEAYRHVGPVTLQFTKLVLYSELMSACDAVGFLRRSAELVRSTVNERAVR